jgi:hypothetical protein
MNKKKFLIGTFICLLAIILYIGLPLSWSVFMYIFDPMGSIRVMDELRALPSETLIKKLRPIHPLAVTPSLSMEVLAERRETEAVPELIKSLKSWHPDNRYQAIRALGNIGDERAVEPLLKIVNEGEVKGKKYYRAALLSLCQIGYEPIRPVVLERLKRPDGARNGSPKMMEYIGKKEDLNLLEEKYNSIHEDNSAIESIEEGSIKTAIGAIKQREGVE